MLFQFHNWHINFFHGFDTAEYIADVHETMILENGAGNAGTVTTLTIDKVFITSVQLAESLIQVCQWNVYCHLYMSFFVFRQPSHIEKLDMFFVSEVFDLISSFTLD